VAVRAGQPEHRVRDVHVQAAEACQRAATRLSTPKATMASGKGHHQCSQKTLRLPWLLSRPAQKTPSKMSNTPPAAPMRLAIELTPTGYLWRAAAAAPGGTSETSGKGG
jgi:hypothetical protein